MKPNRHWVGAAAFAVCLAIVCVMLFNRSQIESRKGAAIENLLKKNWVCYAPTHYNPYRSIYPTSDSIRADLSVLKEAGFDGIITYESKGSLAPIPAIAQDLGLLVIQGIWGPADKEELLQAVRQKDKVVAYCVGNEGLNTRYTLRELDSGVTYVANATGLPVVISEQIHVYFQYQNLARMGDWLFPIVHPHFASAKSMEAANAWILANTEKLRALAEQQGVRTTLFCKEIGMPSSGDPAYSDVEQARFFASLYEGQRTRFAVFEAFDRIGWDQVSSVEPHWGIYRHDRHPKLAVDVIRGIILGKGIPKPGKFRASTLQ